MTAILQITDTHIVAEGKLVSGQLETAAPLTRLVDQIASIRHQIGPIDAVIVSGDLSDDGSEASYARFKRLLAPLDLPTYVIPGITIFVNLYAGRSRAIFPWLDH